MFSDEIADFVCIVGGENRITSVAYSILHPQSGFNRRVTPTKETGFLPNLRAATQYYRKKPGF
jgi:hypothetical protein